MSSLTKVVLVCLGSKLVPSPEHGGQRGHHPSKLRPEEGRSQVGREAQSNAVGSQEPRPPGLARGVLVKHPHCSQIISQLEPTRL